MADIAKVAEELAAEQAAAETPAQVDKPEPAAEPASEGAAAIGAPDADQRIRTGFDREERTLWVSAVFVTLLYALVIAAQVMNLGGLSSIEHELEQQQKERERRGQGGDSISVEIVPEPDFKSKTEKWQEGANGPPTPNPPQPQQQAALPRPKIEEQPQQQPKEQAEEKPTEEKSEEKPQEKPEEKEADKSHEGGQPSLPDLEALVDAAATDLSEKVKEHYDNAPRRSSRPQQQQQATMSGGGMQVRGQGAGGKSDAFTKSVLDALMKTRPGPFALWGRVLVSFQITQQGDLLYVRVVKSSGNKAMDDAAVNAIHRAKFIKPPPDLPPDARTYIIDYVFG